MNVEFFVLAAAYSSKAYNDESPEAMVFEKWSVTAKLWRGGRFDILAFKGSKEFFDWIINLYFFPPRKYGLAWSHRGFSRFHQAIWKDIAPHLNPRKPLILTGHSAGGALAEKSAEFCRDFRCAHLITFGKPNLYWRPSREINTHLQTQISVVHGSDIVARLPRYMYGPDPRQDKLYLSNHGNDYWNPDNDFILDDWRVSEIISDHSMKLYSDRIINLGEIL